MSFVKATVAAIAVAAVSATSAAARDQVHIAGSSTVLPYASIVAEAFGENFDFPTPIVEGGGSGAGRKRMCEGVGLNTIDIANSSSLMKEEQWTTCEATVGKVTEVRIGYDGITFSTRLENTGFEDLTLNKFTLRYQINLKRPHGQMLMHPCLPWRSRHSFQAQSMAHAKCLKQKLCWQDVRLSEPMTKSLPQMVATKKQLKKNASKCAQMAHLWTSTVITQKHWRRWMPTQRGSVSLACHSC